MFLSVIPSSGAKPDGSKITKAGPTLKALGLGGAALALALAMGSGGLGETLVLA